MATLDYAVLGFYFLFMLGSAFFWLARLVPAASTDAVRGEAFVTKTRTPLSAEEIAGANTDTLQFRVIGGLCLVYGGVISLLTVFPQSGAQRLGCLFCGVTIVTIGGLLLWSAPRLTRNPPPAVIVCSRTLPDTAPPA
ncbi:MAG: hypothetical protein AAGE65_09240 [Planctomycetota bacterium]